MAMVVGLGAAHNSAGPRRRQHHSRGRNALAGQASSTTLQQSARRRPARPGKVEPAGANSTR